MPGKVAKATSVTGLSSSEAAELLHQYGYNRIRSRRQKRLLHTLAGILREPMSLLLIVACLLYFVLGNTAEGILMAAAIALISAISVYQEVRSNHAVRALQEFTRPSVTVIRDGLQKSLPSSELVPGDVIVLEEGANVPADALIIQANDFSLNESVVTGESLPVIKNEQPGNNVLYQGTLVNSGKCLARVSATGSETVLGKIGLSVEGYDTQKTILQKQVNKVVKNLALFGMAAFTAIFLVNYFHSGQFVVSLLFALTLAMSAIPEEIPVAFSSFFALGAYRLGRAGIITRQPQILENLGAVNVLCLDKTGTITENRMSLKILYDFKNDSLFEQAGTIPPQYERLLLYAALASEAEPFDAMEKAIIETYLRVEDTSVYHRMEMVYEYPLEGRPPMMTHVYKNGEEIVVAAKGAAERIFDVCHLDPATRVRVTAVLNNMSGKGYRVLGVASSTATLSHLPAQQNAFNWSFEGLLALYDPPRKEMPAFIRKLYEDGIEIKILTGDHAATASQIAGQIGIKDPMRCRNGEEIMQMDASTLEAVVKSTAVFARMFPEAKRKVIKALQSAGNVVAMTGDGVNDGPALKVADIGIAMGKKGSEIARQASDLILTEDNPSGFLQAISEGRRIYSNLLKAVRYILAIHIPILLTASLPVILGWRFPNIFTPVHVIFLELIMGPTCSIFFEREPVSEAELNAGPRNKDQGLFTRAELIMSIVQGLAIAAGTLLIYYLFMTRGYALEETRMAVFTTIICSNVFLTFTGRSAVHTIVQSLKFKNNLAIFVVLASVCFLLLLHLLPPVRSLFGLQPISTRNFLLCLATALVSVLWIELFKRKTAVR